MTFKEDKTEEFKALFDTQKHNIRGFEGVNHLELYRDNKQTKERNEANQKDASEFCNDITVNSSHREMSSLTECLLWIVCVLRQDSKWDPRGSKPPFVADKAYRNWRTKTM